MLQAGITGYCDGWLKVGCAHWRVFHYFVFNFRTGTDEVLVLFVIMIWHSDLALCSVSTKRTRSGQVHFIVITSWCVTTKPCGRSETIHPPFHYLSASLQHTDYLGYNGEEEHGSYQISSERKAET